MEKILFSILKTVVTQKMMERLFLVIAEFVATKTENTLDDEYIEDLKKRLEE